MGGSRLAKTAPYSTFDADVNRGRDSDLTRLANEIRACRICLDRPKGRPLPHEPRPVVRVGSTARIAVCGQAPGTRVHASGVPFTDASGERLRSWMGVSDDEFYDVRRVAVVPMGFCFPGLDASGGDRPPRKECSTEWHERLFQALPQVDLLLLVGSYAQRWHLGTRCRETLTATVADWRTLAIPGPTRTQSLARAFVAPHPSWRNNAWLKKNPWFETDLLPELRSEVRRRLDG